MFDYLIEHAVKNVWCTPEQDLQLILRPARLTPINGITRQIRVGWELVDLPTTHDYYHVYQIGQLAPSLYGIFGSYTTWTSIATICNQETMIINLYTANGHQLARFETFFRLLEDGNVIIAVREQLSINDLNSDQLFVRFYSNAYFSSVRSDATADVIHIGGKRCGNSMDIAEIQQQVRNYMALPGSVDAFVNGVLVKEPSPFNTRIGDIIEYVYDSSVYKTYDLPIYGVNSSTFISELDNSSKSLLMPEVPPDNWIDYADDIDCWVLYPDGNNYTGFYYNKNHERYFRNVTHKDYSIDNDQIEAIRALNADRFDATVFPVIRLKIRHGGYQRPVIHEHHRIKELYKLPYLQIKQAMIGTNATVPVWRVQALEASAYCQLMAAKTDTIDIALVQNGYGYNAITRLVADSPLPIIVDNNIRQVEIPKAAKISSTIFEYDSNGLLLGFYPHGSGDVWLPHNQTTSMIEAWPSPATHTLDISFNTNNVSLDPALSYRFYRCPIISGLPTWDWEDITNSGMYTIQNGHAVWGLDQNLYYTAIKSDASALVYTLQLDPPDGLYRFTVTNTEFHQGVSALRPMTIPPGMLEVWLNGYSLIEGLDYFVQWPEVVITNKRYLRVDAPETITVKCTGFCNADLSREAAPDVGFVEYHTLSRNSRFDVRDDKVVNIVVAGARYRRDELTFSEDDDGISVDDEVNGLPYAIWSTGIPLRRLVDIDSQAFRAISIAVDKTISDYLTPKLPDRSHALPSMIPERYEIYSPFASKVMTDLQRGVLGGDRIRTRYTESDIHEILTDYLYLLDYEPTRANLNMQYVSIHPTSLYNVAELDIYEYTFLDRAIKMYLDNAVDISKFVKIGLPR